MAFAAPVVVGMMDADAAAIDRAAQKQREAEWLASLPLRRRLSEQAQALRPVGVALKLRSVIVCMAMAVEESAIAKPVINAVFQSSPTIKPPAASAVPHSES